MPGQKLPKYAISSGILSSEENSCQGVELNAVLVIRLPTHSTTMLQLNHADY